MALIVDRYHEGGRDACVGDSGGPLFLIPAHGRSDGGTILIGVVSWGIECAAAKTPGVYSRTDKLLDLPGTDPWRIGWVVVINPTPFLTISSVNTIR